MKKLIILILCLFFIGCGNVRVKTSWGFMGPDTYVATNGKVEVRYENGQCCCVAKKVLENLADKANSGLLDWSKMEDKEYQEKVLKDECDLIKNVRH